jgi:ApbE superfamily uncharacterized protein (UPF0280 family)
MDVTGDRPEYVDRTYRASMQAEDLVAFSVKIEQTDLYVLAERDLTAETTRAARRARSTLEGWIDRHPEFAQSMAPISCPPDAPGLVRDMCAAGQAAGVGPMAAVAGAIAEYVARALQPTSPNVIVENGGDTYLMGARRRLAAIFAGRSALSNRFGLVIPPEKQPIAVCTSSGTVGPSVSLGEADAAVIAAQDGALADAVATATANRVRTAEDLSGAVEFAAALEGVQHAVVIAGDEMAMWGNLSLERLR